MNEEHYVKLWTDADFESLSWHDCRIHGFSLWNPWDIYDFDLVLDMDYILEWFRMPGQAFEFNVAPARIRFFHVDNLQIDIRLRYKESIEIHEIEREEITTDPQREAGIRGYKWKIMLNSNGGDQCVISFDATGFQLGITKAPIRTDRQSLM